MNIKVCLLSDHHISVNPRLWKEAFYYEKKGFEVVILTKWQSSDLLIKDRDILLGHNISYKFYLNLIPGEINELSRFFYRVTKKLGGLLHKYFKIGTRYAISHGLNVAIKRANEEKANFYIAHMESSFYVGRVLAKNGKKVVFDFEDWYSNDYLVPERPVKLLQKLEEFAVRNGLFCTAASKSMASEIENQYKSSRPLEVIYNGFAIEQQPVFNTKIYVSNDFVKILWFSRTIGPDRGLEYLLVALENCYFPIELHLLGDIVKDYDNFLEQRFVKLTKHQLVIHSFIPHKDLDYFISQFQIGLAIEENINKNKILTISNKILQYLQAGIPVLATKTKGQQEVAEIFPATIKLVDIDRPESWNSKIIELLDVNEQKLFDQKILFNKIFSWDEQEKKLDKLIAKYFIC